MLVVRLCNIQVFIVVLLPLFNHLTLFCHSYLGKFWLAAQSLLRDALSFLRFLQLILFFTLLLPQVVILILEVMCLLFLVVSRLVLTSFLLQHHNPVCIIFVEHRLLLLAKTIVSCIYFHEPFNTKKGFEELSSGNAISSFSIYSVATSRLYLDGTECYLQAKVFDAF